MALCRGCLSFGNAFAILRFSSAGTTNGFPSSRCASAIQIDASRTTASVCSRRNEEGYASKKFAISDHKFKSPLTMFPRYGFQITSRSRKPKVAASATASWPICRIEYGTACKEWTSASATAWASVCENRAMQWLQYSGSSKRVPRTFP